MNLKINYPPPDFMNSRKNFKKNYSFPGLHEFENKLPSPRLHEFPKEFQKKL